MHSMYRSTYLHKAHINGHKGRGHSTIIIVGDFKTLLTLMNISSRQNTNKETMALNDTLDQIDLIGVLKHFTPKQNIHYFQAHTEHFSG